MYIRNIASLAIVPNPVSHSNLRTTSLISRRSPCLLPCHRPGPCLERLYLGWHGAFPVLQCLPCCFNFASIAHRPLPNAWLFLPLFPTTMSVALPITEWPCSSMCGKEGLWLPARLIPDKCLATEQQRCQNGMSTHAPMKPESKGHNLLRGPSLEKMCLLLLSARISQLKKYVRCPQSCTHYPIN